MVAFAFVPWSSFSQLEVVVITQILSVLTASQHDTRTSKNKRSIFENRDEIFLLLLFSERGEVSVVVTAVWYIKTIREIDIRPTVTP